MFFANDLPYLNYLPLIADEQILIKISIKLT